jgi:2-keto-3-deoxy-L-rhamnonate aldolase RhmA
MRTIFRQKLITRHVLGGTFLKTPSYLNVEILDSSGLDFIVIDTEHAVFGPMELDQCILAARSGKLASLVRLPDARPETILRVLDMGASGVVIPHIIDAAGARAVIASTRYENGTRGFSNSPRAGGFGAATMREHVHQSDVSVSVVCQIEDRAGVENIEEIVAVPGIDCLLIGRADLALSYGVFELDHPLLEQAIDRILSAASAAKVAVGIFLGDTTQVDKFLAKGVSLFLVGSDQALLRVGSQTVGKVFQNIHAQNVQELINLES